MSESDLGQHLAGIVGDAHVLMGESVSDDYGHDEALTVVPVRPQAVVRPKSADQVAGVLRMADELGVPVTPRGSGTGLSGACTPNEDGIVISFERMNQVLEIDTANHVAVVQPGVTLDDLEKAAAAEGLLYPVRPGEMSGSLGGNVATNAGGMNAVKYGVTRHQVLGLEAVLPSGEVIRTGGRFVKATTGYDLTQLIIGSEGTLAVVTEVILKLQPLLEHRATVLAPFGTLDEVTTAVPAVVSSGVGPMILEYIDLVTMSGITEAVGLDLGIPDDVRQAALAYLVVVVESTHADRLDGDVQLVAELLGERGAIDVYVLPPQAATQLLEAREKAFWVAKSHGAHDIIDLVVPRASIPEYMEQVSAIAADEESLVVGCGHAGDGNVHLSVFQPDPDRRDRLIHRILEAGTALGGAISGEHGIGTEKRSYFLELEHPAKVALMQRIKAAFDPNGILNPGTLFDAAGRSPGVAP